MADLNALIAQGAQFQAPVNPFVQYGQMQQLQQGEQANQLNQMKMQEMQRTMGETNAMRQLDPNSPTYLADITRISPEKGFALSKLRQEAKTAGTESDIKSTKLIADKLALLPDAYRMADTPEAYLALHKSIHADPVLGPYLNSVGATPEKGLATLQNAVQTGKFNELRMGSMQSVAQILESMKPPAPTETNRLIKERETLLTSGVPPTDPRIQAYDQKLASGESQSAKLQRELQVAIANKAAPAVISQLQRDIKNLHPGLAMQNVTGVDASGNQIVTRFSGAGGGPQGQFALKQAPTSTARAMLGLDDADSALLFGPGGPVEKGLIPISRLTPSNARMFVASVKANPDLNLTNLSEEQILQNAKARAQGGVQGKQVLTLADRTTAKNIAQGNLPPLTGPNASRIMNEVVALKPDYKANDYGLQTSAIKAFNQGTQGNKVRSLNVVADHFTTLEKAADALQSGDVRAINAISQFIETQTGKPAPTNFNAIKEILADEIVASVVPGTGALADRQAIKKTIVAASSPEQLKGVVANYKELIAGQLNGLETQYKAGTGRNDFKTRLLTSEAARSLAPSSAGQGGGGGAVDTSNPYLK
jgi:hypothetical protein